MIEVAMQKHGKSLHAMSSDDEEKLSELHDHQICRVKISGVKKPRSYRQLQLFWVCCEKVAENSSDPSWSTKDLVAEQVKLALRYIDAYMVVDGKIHIKTRSISFQDLPHMEACEFFDRAFAVMAEHLGIDVDALVAAAQ